MLKKLLAVSAVLAFSSTVAVAAAAPYVGVGLGVNALSSKISNNAVTANKLGANSALLNVFGGFGGLVNPTVYLGGELFINAASTTAKSNSAVTYTKLTAKNSVGISFIPGIMLSEHTMAYARAGIVRTGFSVKSLDSNSYGVSVYNSKSQARTGGQLGLGMQAGLTQNVDLRGEYVYTSYGSFKVQGTKYTPSSNQFNVAVVYKFE
jgi:opacity protein-like surface antigen